MPANSRPEGFDLALIGLSTRALARSARAGGLRAMTFDLFADADTREHAAKAVRVDARGRGFGFDPKALIAALAAHAPPGLPVAFGAGFEDATGLMAEIGRRHPIRGATPQTVAALKEPFAFAETLALLGVAHPKIADSAAFLNLSPAGRGRPEGPGEGVSRSPDKAAAPSPAAARAASTSPQLNSGVPELSKPEWRSRKHPTSLGEVKEGRWLSKRIGASGGAHIRSAQARAIRRRYVQRHVCGAPFSALFLADGRAARVVGFSGQWADPTAASPFRYGGAVGPIAIPAARGSAVADALDRIVAATGLVGLASADMLAPDDRSAGFTLLEINPRPGATLDVFEGAVGPSLLAAHLAACDGRLPDHVPEPACVRAAAVVYAPRATTVSGLERPVWTADWPADGEVIPAGAPVCTVLASASSPDDARALVERRRAALLASLPSARRKAAASSRITVSA